MAVDTEKDYSTDLHVPGRSLVVNWINEEAFKLVTLGTVGDDIAHAVRNRYTLKQFMDTFHIEDISHFRRYTSSKDTEVTLVFIDSDVYCIDESWVTVGKNLIEMSYTVFKRNNFQRLIDKTQTFINMGKVIDVTPNFIHFQHSVIPIKYKSDKACELLKRKWEKMNKK